jgi:TonB family protein
MTNSTITADSAGASFPASASFRWEVPHKAISIHLSLDVVDRLERDVIESFKAITKRGSEVGGILLGRVAPATNKRTVFVENYELVECDYARGPLYLLADADKERLRETLARLKAPGPLSVVGFFRSNTRRDLMLDEEDLAVIEEFFADPDRVFLLVKPFAMKPSNGGFFFWEDGKIHSEASYLEFPFRRSELLKGFAPSVVPASTEKAAPQPRPAQPAIPAAGEEAAKPPVTVKREEPAANPEERAAAPKPVTIPRPTPLPFRREDRPAVVPVSPKPVAQPAAPPVTVKREEPPVTVKREERPAAPPVSVKREEPRPAPPPVTVKREERPVAVTAKREENPMPAAVKREAPPAPLKQDERPAAKATAPAAPAVPAPAFSLGGAQAAAPLPAEAPARKLNKNVLVGAAAAVVVAICVLLYLLLGNHSAQTADASGLNLRIERNAGQLVVSWNRSAPAIATARKATLYIQDGENNEPVDLALEQLRAGSVWYSPLTNDVSFKLELTDPQSGKTTSELVRYLAGRPSPAVAATEQPGATVPSTSAPAPAQTAAVTQPAATQPAATQPKPAEPQPEGAAPKQFQPPVTAAPPRPESLAARLSRPAEEIPEPPTLADQSNPLSGRPMLSVPQVNAAAPPRPAAPRPQQAAPAPNVGGRVQEAVLRTRVEPVYPPLAKQARVSGIVTVQATIGADGRVKKAVAVSGPPLLRPAAVDAVNRWIYEPGKLNGQPVETTANIQINFSMSR